MYGVDASKKTSKLKKSYFVNASKKTEKLKKCYVVSADKKLVKLWSGGFSNISYYSALTPTSSATKTGYMSGYIFSSTDWVSTYDSSLTFATGNATLSNQRSDMASASTSNHAFFAGGVTASLGANYQHEVDVFDASLTRSVVSSLPTYASVGVCGLSMNGNAVFAGGTLSGNYSTKITVYDDSLTQTTYDSGLTSRSDTVGAAVGGYALFAPATISGSATSTTVEVVDSSFTKINTQALTTTSSSLSKGFYAESVGDYAIFLQAGGGSQYRFVFDKSLTLSKTSATNVLNYATDAASHTAVDGFAIFCHIVSSSATKKAYVYDQSLTLTTFDMEGTQRDGSTAGHVGNYIIVYGGDDNTDSVMVKAADVFQLS